MENIQVIENLKSLLVEYTSNTETQIANNLTMIFQSFQNKSLKEDIDNYAEFVLLGASLFELKAKRLLPQDEEVDWLDEVELIKDKDLAFARLLQFKAFTEVGLALAIKVKQTEREIPAFKYYQTKLLLFFYNKKDFQMAKKKSKLSTRSKISKIRLPLLFFISFSILSRISRTSGTSLLMQQNSILS